MDAEQSGPPVVTDRGKLRWWRLFEGRRDGEWFVVTETTRRPTPFELRARINDGTYRVPGGPKSWEMVVAKIDDSGERENPGWRLWARWKR